MTGPRRRFTEVEKQLVRLCYPDSLTSDLAKVLETTEARVAALANRLGVHKTHEFKSAQAKVAMADPNHGGRKAQFKKGQEPANKGLKRPGWSVGNMAVTQFKKGHKPHTWVPVGTYRVNDGYLERKITDLPGPPNVRWHGVHRIVWEEANGPTPAGHVVVFKPGRFSNVLENITLDAVELVSRAELMRRNTIHNYPEEITNVMRLRGVLKRAIKKRKKEGPHEAE